MANGTSSLWPYVQIARVDHWFKNAFMLLGVVLAFFYEPELGIVESLPMLGLALLATCLVASSNYVLNEWLDATVARLHPVKMVRPAAKGLIKAPIAVAEWLLLGAVGIGLAFSINTNFGISAAALWIMGCAYNIRPVRMKDLPYLDVLSESVNNPLRLLLGWFALIPNHLPPVSLSIAYWMVGAYFMATKRFAEYRKIGDKQVAASYRASFGHYNADRLLISMLFYVTACAFFGGIFVVRYKLELIVVVPVVAGFFAYYLALGLKPDSPVQNPEKLYKEKGFLLYALFTTFLFIALMYVRIPVLYDLFNVEPSQFAPLWSIGYTGSIGCTGSIG